MYNAPKLLFKFRSISSVKSLVRTYDIIQNNRLYFPKRNDLNDPMEGSMTHISLGVAGAGIYQSVDKEHPYISTAKNKYNLLSLSETCFSPPLWAYYADTYAGICLGFKTNHHFKKAVKVNYIFDRPDSEQEPDDFDSIIQKDLLYKHSDWSHEKEWRIIEKDGNNYFEYDSDELACIIIGHCADIEVVHQIRKLLPSTLPVFSTYIGTASLSIKLIDIDEKIELCGKPPNFICDVEQLYKRILS